MSKKAKELPEIVEKPIEEVDICEELVKNFDEISEEVNGHRAFPYIASGFKPVHEHIAWSMWANHRRSANNYTKSAKCVGEVMAYNPHGDSYEAMARMAQDFINHVPFIDGHGGFGSAIGGPAVASSRYTEMRLTKFTEDILFYNTKLLEMGLNYLEEDPEPILNRWVSLLPTLHIADVHGIGNTSKTDWSPGNLFEFRDKLQEYLKTGNVSCDNIYPDFPTGGIIINKADMKSLYETGKGTIKLRGKTEIVGNVIKIYSLPFNTFPEDFVDQVLTQAKAGKLVIKDVRNLCGKSKFLLEVECEDETAEYTLDRLFKDTCLQITIPDEHKAIDEAGRPLLVSFPMYVQRFVEDNVALVVKEANINIDDITARLEIVNGLLSALEIIDDIIAAIKKSESMADAKKTLMTQKVSKRQKELFTDSQAEEIVHTPLGRLANLERVKLEDELKTLEKRLQDNIELRDNRKKQEKYFYNRFNKLVEEYGWERKTEVEDIINEENNRMARMAKPTKLKVEKEYKIVLTSENNLKRIELSKYKATTEDEKAVTVVGNQQIILISNRGTMYKVLTNTIDICLPSAVGVPVKSVRPEAGDEKILAMYSEDVSLPYIFFVTKNFVGKKCTVENTLMISKRVGATVISFKDPKDELFAVKLLDEGEKIELTTNMQKKIIDPGEPQGRGGTGKYLMYVKKKEVLLEVHSVPKA